MRELVEAGNLGQKTGKGFYEHGKLSRRRAGTLVERFALKALVEACLVLEEGVAAAKDIEIGMMMGAGILPGPFARADEAGLDEMLEALERAEAEWGEAFEPPHRSCGAWSPRAGSARRPARASSPTRSPTRATSARRCCSRRAATSRSPGSTGRRRTRSRPR